MKDFFQREKKKNPQSLPHVYCIQFSHIFDVWIIIPPLWATIEGKNISKTKQPNLGYYEETVILVAQLICLPWINTCF